MSFLKRIFGFLRRNWWKVLLGLLGLLIIMGVISLMQPTPPEYVTAVSKRGDLVQTVEAVGTVTSERDLNLQFPLGGIVQQVLVKEGDKVKAGQRLAVIRNGSQGAAVASAVALLNAAQADLRAMQEGTRVEDLAIAEADVQSKQSSLDAARSSLKNAEDTVKSSEEKLRSLESQLDIDLQSTIGTVGSTVSAELADADTALSTLKDVLANNNLADAIIRSDSSEGRSLDSRINASQSLIAKVRGGDMNPSEFSSALSLLEKARSTLQDTALTIDIAYNVVANLQLTSNMSTNEREAFKAQIASQRSTVQSAISVIDAKKKTLQDTSAGNSTQIITEQNTLTRAKGERDRALADIATYEAAVTVAKAQLDLKKAGARQTDLDAQAARVRQYQAEVARTSASFRDTILTAPVAGTVTNVAVKVGEYTPSGPAVTMLGQSPFRVEMFVSEIDIPKVQATQTGSIELDAFPGVDYDLRVAEVDTGSSKVEGATKYRVKLDFVYPHSDLKIDMSGDAKIITGERKDVISVPRRAIIEKDGKETIRIKKDDGTIEERTVVSGMEGEGGDTEVTGINEGETVVVLIKE